MTYAIGGRVDALDYNTFNNAASSINQVWATGTGIRGYGQTNIANVAIGDYVTSAQWTRLVDTLNAINRHQFNANTAIANTQVEVADRIVVLNSAPTVLTNAITAVNASPLNCATQGASSSTSNANNTAWQNILTWEITVSYSNTNQMRNWWNAGGQIAVSVAHGATGGINDIIGGMCTNMGTIWFSSQSGVTLAGTSWTGTQRIGGAGGTVNTGIGFHSLSGTNTTLYTATSGSTLFGSRYASSAISLLARTSGSSIIFTLTVDENWTGGVGPQVGLAVGTPTTASCTVRDPETTNLTNTWGRTAPSFVITVRN